MNTLDYIILRFNIGGKFTAKRPIAIADFDRAGMAELFHELEFKEGAEVGVERGLYSEILCKANPGLKLHCIDVWKSYRGYMDFVKSMESNYQEAKKRLEPYDCNLIRKYSMDAVKDFKDESLDFVYIDGNHDLQNVINDLTEWSKKLKKGGIMCGDDYRIHTKPSRMHVVEAVTTFTHVHEIKPWFVLGARAKDDRARDNNRNFMWVK